MWIYFITESHLIYAFIHVQPAIETRIPIPPRLCKKFNAYWNLLKTTGKVSPQKENITPSPNKKTILSYKIVLTSYFRPIKSTKGEERAFQYKKIPQCNKKESPAPVIQPKIAFKTHWFLFKEKIQTYMHNNPWSLHIIQEAEHTTDKYHIRITATVTQNSNNPLAKERNEK